MSTVFASSDDAELRLSEGTIVEGIEVGAEIERGGMAIVYRGRRVVDGRDVALKVGTAEAARHQTEERFKNEALVAGALQHPNIVRPIQVGPLDGPAGFEGRMHLVTDLVEGRTLGWLMVYHQQGMPPVRAVALAAQLAEAMVAMHEQGVVHRDLKPANLIIDDDDNLHVIDFGLAYALGDGEATRSPDLTIEGAAPGTPLYMSPQQAMHLEPRRAFDVYAFGVILYELLSGAAPNSGLPSEEIVSVRCNPKSRLFPLRRVAPTTPVALVELVERCLAYDTDERPTSAEIVSALAGIASLLREGDEEAHPQPSVIARGARPAGEETMARLVEEKVDLPSVKRVRELADEFVGRGGEGRADERRIIPLADVRVAIALAKDEGSVDGSCREEEDVVTQDVEGEGRKKKLGAIAVACSVFLVCVGVMGMLLQAPRAAVLSEMMHGLSVATREMVVEDEPAPPEVEPSPPEVEPSTADSEPRPGEIETETETEPEPEPELEPVVEPGGQPVKRQKAHRPATKTADPSHDPATKPGPLTPCAAQRVEARAASKSKEWKAVLASTEDASCWSSKVERARLRASALRALGRYSACVRVSAGHDDPELVRLTGECYRRASEGEQ